MTNPQRTGPPQEARSGTKRVRKKISLEERREKIVTQATILFLERGYDAVSINDVIDVAGGSKATIYALFGDKSGLFDAVLRQHISAVSLSIETNTTGPIAKQLAQIGRVFLTNVLNSRILEFHRMMISLGRTSPAHSRAFYEAGPKTAYRVFAGWIAERQAAGLLSPGDAHENAILFHDMLMTEFQLALLTGDIVEIDEAAIDRKVAACVELFMFGSAPVQNRRKPATGARKGIAP